MAPSKSTETNYEYLCRIVATRDDDECWIWPFAINEHGYGVVFNSPEHRTRLTHRLAYFLRYRLWPVPIGLHSRECVSRSCFNPHHIRSGDHKDNYNDCVAMGRSKFPVTHRGENHGKAILTDDLVRQIRVEYVHGTSTRNRGNRNMIIAKYGITLATLRDISQRKSWRHI